MILFKKRADLQEALTSQKAKKISIGFVPTMGALHEGHLSLIESSRKENDLTVCSIFVNPTQFNDPRDFEKYPVTIEKDIQMLESAGCDLLFLPPVNEVYPVEPGAAEHYELGQLETLLEGEFRPGHFQGVCQVVSRLLHIVMPHNLYLGQKDYQQCMVIRRLIQLMGLEAVINVRVCPTRREPDGLAMSSRNLRLSAEQRRMAPAIYSVLTALKEHLAPGVADRWKQEATRSLVEQGFRPEYVELANADTLEIIHDWDGRTELVALVAAFLGEIRLIDNMIIYGKQ